MLSSVPETIRTSDPSLRRRVLYPLSYEDLFIKHQLFYHTKLPVATTKLNF